MSKDYIYKPPTAKQAQRHWQSQEPSVFRKPKTKDRGVAIVNSREQARAIVAAELTEGPQEVYRLKTPVGEWIDPLSRMNDMIRLHTQKGLSAEEFRSLCQTPDDLMLFEYLYGEMTASQRGTGLIKIADQMFRKQQEVLKQVNIEKQREDKKAATMIKARAQLAKRLQKDTGE